MPYALCPCAAGAAILDTDAPKTINAPKIEYNVKSSDIKTTGTTVITNQSGQRMTLVDSHLSGRGANASGENVEMFLGQNVYVSADAVSRDDGNTTAHDALFTACHGCDDIGNAWEITTTELFHDVGRQTMSFYNPVFYAYGVPAFWLPYISMPDPTVKRKNGVLMPDFNSTNNMGTQFNIPVYVALSDTHDLTATFSYLTQENPLFQLEHRLNGKHSQFRTAGSYTRNREDLQRWHLFNNDTVELGENARARIFLARASDKTYLQKYGFYDDQPYLDSGARVDLFGQSGYVSADMHVFQELRAASRTHAIPAGDILPNIRGVYQTAPIFHETYATLGADVLGIMGDGTSSQRVIGDAQIVSPWTLPFGNRITASMSARYDIYNFNNTIMMGGEEFSGIKSRFLPSASVEWGLPLANAGNDWTHIIEPRARITVMPELSDAAFALNNDSAGALLSDATLFSNNRFSGLDMWENGTFADYGMRWAAHHADGRKAEVFLGQTYDFNQATDVDPNSGFRNGASDWVGRVGFDTASRVGLYSRFRFARDTMDLRHLETSASVDVASNTNIYLGHIWAAQFIDAATMDENIHEVSGGIGVGLTDRWSVRFNGVYNITEQKFQRHTGGIYYNHPCYYLSMEYRLDSARKADYVGNTTFQFKFGLALNGVKQ
jgi:LPS-assembly protein